MKQDLSVLLRLVRLSLTTALLGLSIVVCGTPDASAALLWCSPNHYRTPLIASFPNADRRNAVAIVNIDFPQMLRAKGSTGTFDLNTVEVVAYNAAGQPKVFDSSRPGYEQYLVPHRIQPYYGAGKVTLSFVIPDETCVQFVAYFDTVGSGLGKPDRYTGVVGNGDWFREGYKRREINACHFDQFVDFDGDGDLDLFKGGVEPFVYCYENVGENKMVDRGRLASGGNVLTMPSSADNRSWMSVAFRDIDGDGDQDFFPSFTDGPDAGKFIYYKNTTAPNGVLTFSRVGPLRTIFGTDVGGGAQAGGWFPSICFVRDWDGDGDGRDDILVGTNNHCWLYRSLGFDVSGNPQFADAVAVQAGGADIYLDNPRFDCADIDNDGDLDLFSGCQPGPIRWYQNIGTRNAPVFAAGSVIAYGTPYFIGDAHSSVKVADWDGDGLLDIVAGRYWERTPTSEAGLPRYFGGLYKNIGTATLPVFAKADEYHDSPYTEQFQPCDAVRQNGVRTVDWNNDGKPDLIAGDTDGFVWYFANLTNRFFPIFQTGVKLNAGGQILNLMGTGGHARPDVADWNNDGKKDLIVADGNGSITLFLNTGTDANPVLAAGTRLSAGGILIDSPGSRSSVLVCDWNNDGKKDVIQGDDSGYYYYRNTNTDASPTLASGSLIKPGGQSVTYNRPNVGSYVCWDDEDTKKDFIGCNFENSVRFYRNTGSGGVNVNPTFAPSGDGETILKDYSIMVISGADVKDWNGDGTFDILTGQGHGGSGLRVFTHQFIDDTNNGTLPTVATLVSERGLEAGEVKALPNGGATISVPRGIVTAASTNYFYVESETMSSGIRVQRDLHGYTIGQRVDVWGVPATNENGERFISASTILPNGSGSVSEVMLTNNALGGGNFYGQMGVTSGTGLNNIGLLIKSTGKCTLNLASPDTGGDYYGAYYVFIDDGSGVLSWYRDRNDSWQQVGGIKLEVNDPSIAVGDRIVARGISSIELVNEVYQRRLSPRSGMGDVVKL